MGDFQEVKGQLDPSRRNSLGLGDFLENHAESRFDKGAECQGHRYGRHGFGELGHPTSGWFIQKSNGLLAHGHKITHPAFGTHLVLALEQESEPDVLEGFVDVWIPCGNLCVVLFDTASLSMRRIVSTVVLHFRRYEAAKFANYRVNAFISKGNHAGVARSGGAKFRLSPALSHNYSKFRLRRPRKSPGRTPSVMWDVQRTGRISRSGAPPRRGHGRARLDAGSGIRYGFPADAW